MSRHLSLRARLARLRRAHASPYPWPEAFARLRWLWMGV